MTDPFTNTKIILPKSSAESDLGINITTNLKSTVQANKAASKANSMLGLMRRTIVSGKDLHNMHQTILRIRS